VDIINNIRFNLAFAIWTNITYLLESLASNRLFSIGNGQIRMKMITILHNLTMKRFDV